MRDAAFPTGWSEWDLVLQAKPQFEGHEQPNLPLWGPQDESQPEVFQPKLDAAADHGISLFVFAFYWSRGKRLLQGALDQGYLGCADPKVQFALMWANRMPRKVLPVKDPAAQLIDPTRLVHTDPEDFLAFIQYVGTQYFGRPHYYRCDGACYLSIFDTNFFLRQLGPELATKAIANAREWLRQEDLGELHLAAIDPTPEFQPLLREIGFDSVTHYVLLPEWKGERLQDYRDMATQRENEWAGYPERTGLPYMPSVSPGWDANPRAVDYGKEKPGRYPWSPIITGRSPEVFEDHIREAVAFALQQDDPMCMIASWNEWSEGHYLEPDEQHGYGWLEAVERVAYSIQ